MNVAQLKEYCDSCITVDNEEPCECEFKAECGELRHTYGKYPFEFDIERVTIPACEQHDGTLSVSVYLDWVCPVCGGRRGTPFPTQSFDGSRRLSCDGWKNPCGHVDKYADVRREAENNGYNAKTERR